MTAHHLDPEPGPPIQTTALHLLAANVLMGIAQVGMLRIPVPVELPGLEIEGVEEPGWIAPLAFVSALVWFAGLFWCIHAVLRFRNRWHRRAAVVLVALVQFVLLQFLLARA